MFLFDYNADKSLLKLKNRCERLEQKLVLYTLLKKYQLDGLIEKILRYRNGFNALNAVLQEVEIDSLLPRSSYRSDSDLLTTKDLANQHSSYISYFFNKKKTRLDPELIRLQSKIKTVLLDAKSLIIQSNRLIHKIEKQNKLHHTHSLSRQVSTVLKKSAATLPHVPIKEHSSVFKRMMTTKH